KIDAANGGEVEAGQVNLQQNQDPFPASLFPASGFLTFSSVENIKGGGSRDVFLMVGTGSIDSIDGGSNGQDLIDYTQYSTPVIVNLDAGTATGVTGITGIMN